MSLLYHAYVYLEFLILACTIYILAPDSCINMMYFMYLWLPFIFDIIITVILSFLNVESANMKLKENMQNQ